MLIPNNTLPNGEKIFEFEKFAASYPKAAHEMDPEKFCKYVRETICESLTDAEIETIVQKDILNFYQEV